MDIARSSLSDTELFLNNGFKTIFAKDLVALILKWFDEKFMVIYRADAIKVMRKFANPKENTVYIERTLTDAAKAFGVRSNACLLYTSHHHGLLVHIHGHHEGP